MKFDLVVCPAFLEGCDVNWPAVEALGTVLALGVAIGAPLLLRRIQHLHEREESFELVHLLVDTVHRGLIDAHTLLMRARGEAPFPSEAEYKVEVIAALVQQTPLSQLKARDARSTLISLYPIVAGATWVIRESRSLRAAGVRIEDIPVTHFLMESARRARELHDNLDRDIAYQRRSVLRRIVDWWRWR